MVNPTVKKYFNQKMGFSEKALQGLSDMITGSLEDNATEDEINEKCKEFEPIARSFQSEIDRAKAAAMKSKSGEAGTEGSKDEESADETKGTDPTLKALQDQVAQLMKEKTTESLNTKVKTKLKDLKLTEKEIDSLMFGRTFETEDQIEEFVTKQGEFYEDIVKDRTVEKAGTGFVPGASRGNVSKTSIENDIKEFNEKY